MEPNQIEEIKVMIEEMIASQKDPHQSESIAELAPAFAKAQSIYKNVGYNRENPFFKSQYADLNAVLNGVRDALSQNGLSFYQYTEICPKTDSVLLKSRLLHSSGQWIQSVAKLLPPKNDQQSFGSTLSYQRRYGAMTLLGITISGDTTDDDGEHTRKNYEETLTDTQTTKLLNMIDGDQDMINNLLSVFKIDHVSYIPKKMFDGVMRKIKDSK